MRNVRMKEKLDSHEAVDVSPFPREGNYFVLDSYADDIDYCDAASESWVWSIGRRKRDGRILASLTADLYQNPDFECLWLR
jgi:hypothetical protein